MNQMMKTYFSEDTTNNTAKASKPANQLVDLWPGVQLYYPPIKYLPAHKEYENFEQAEARFEKHCLSSQAHTVLFDLEDGCQKKEESRQLLRKLAGRLENKSFQVAVRINCFLSDEYNKDLQLIQDIAPHVDVVMLAKAGERYGLAEIRDLSAELVKSNPAIQIQPIIEHPRALKIANQLMDFSSVQHVVFGIHDFSKSMGIHITAHDWLNELKSWLHLLLLEARLHGVGVIGGVDTVINRTLLPAELNSKDEIEEWVKTDADDETKIVFGHAMKEASMGLTGKQVIHPNHIEICRAAFQPDQSEIERSEKILEIAAEASAFRGGAIRYEDEMLDPPMFGKAIQTLLTAKALKVLPGQKQKALEAILPLVPSAMLKEIWPFGLHQK